MAKPREETTLLDASNHDNPRTIADSAYEAAISGEGWPSILDDLRYILRAKAIALIDHRLHARFNGQSSAKRDFIHQSIGLEPGLRASQAVAGTSEIAA